MDGTLTITEADLSRENPKSVEPIRVTEDDLKKCEAPPAPED